MPKKKVAEEVVAVDAQLTAGVPELFLGAKQLVNITGLSDRRHRQLADEGFFPAPMDGKYSMEPTLRGICRYYRESRTVAKEKKAQIEFERHRKLKIENDRNMALIGRPALA